MNMNPDNPPVRSRRALATVLIAIAMSLCQIVAADPDHPDPLASFVAPPEFERQEFIWLSWVERGWLGGPPFSDVTIDVLREITPQVKVRLLLSSLTPDDPSYFGTHKLAPEAAKERLRQRLEREGIDLSRVELFYHPQPVGVIQDPGPYFLRAGNGALAIADYGFEHPAPEIEALDRDIARQLGLPTIKSTLVSEGGGRQVNGRGTLLLVESVELARNPKMSREEIAREHQRVLGVNQVIWLKQGPADEEAGRLADGRWGIGTGGHVDVFARFADERTILLAEVDERQRDASPIARETHRRMEENLRILEAARDETGKPFRILRVPVTDLMTASVGYDSLTAAERTWFEGARTGEQLEFYLPGGYLNFIIANDAIVTARFWKEGMPESQKTQDRLAREALERAFPGRGVVQVDATALYCDGGGLHCYSRNQPFATPTRQ